MNNNADNDDPAVVYLPNPVVVKNQTRFVQLYGILSHDTNILDLSERVFGTFTCSDVWRAECASVRADTHVPFVAVRPIALDNAVLAFCYMVLLLWNGGLAIAYCRQFDVRILLALVLVQTALVALLVSAVHLVRMSVNPRSLPATIGMRSGAFAGSASGVGSDASSTVRLELEPDASAGNWRWFFTIVGLIFALVLNIAYIFVAIFTPPLNEWREAPTGAAGAFWTSIGVTAGTAFVVFWLFCAYTLDRYKFSHRIVFRKSKNV